VNAERFIKTPMVQRQGTASASVWFVPKMCHPEGQRPRVTFGLDDDRLSGLPIVIASDVLDFVLPVHTDKVFRKGRT